MFELGRVATLRRYPVKSMLGEDIIESDVTTSGLVGDRVVALVDVETGHVATAKHPKAWRYLLGFGARWSDGTIQITTPAGVTVSVEDRDADQTLSDLLHRPVHLSHVRPERAAVARPAPEDVIAEGEDADVPYEMLEIGHGTPGSTFVDYAAVHIITSTTLAEIGAEMVRYRPNIVLSTPGSTPFSENDWPGREIVIGEVRLRVLIPTPRCAVPTLAHGELPRRTDAVQRVLNANRINVPGFGVLPCLGAYAEVVNGGTIALGDVASLSEEV